MKILNRDIIGKKVLFKGTKGKNERETIKGISYPDIIWTKEKGYALNWFEETKKGRIEIRDGEYRLKESEILVEPSGFVFATFNHNFGDEFNINSCAVMLREEFDDDMVFTKKNLSHIFKTKKELEILFGTNQYLLFYSSKEYLSAFKFIKCSEEIYSFIKKVSGNGNIGTAFPFPFEY